MTPAADDEPQPPAPRSGVPKNPLNPKKLLHTKWTAATPRSKEKHFLVIRVVEPEAPAVRVEQVELEAVHSRRTTLLPWRALTDAAQWRQGWV
jgi:tryptophan-rich hypothetical protein